MKQDRPRISITITKPLHDWLEAEAERLGISIAELVRRLLDQHRKA